MSDVAHPSAIGPSTSRAWRQTFVLTAVAVALFAFVRWLPLAGGSLHYSDFGAGERGFLEFCEPGTPQFAPVDRVHSPVQLELRTAQALVPGVAVEVTAALTTTSGKRIVPDDLLLAHTRKLHLLVIDASLNDYQHVHPTAQDGGDFVFVFTPQRAGRYRVFADFMPRATGRSLYAATVLDVAAPASSAAASTVDSREQTESTVDGIRFQLGIDPAGVRINQTARLVLTMARADGGALELEDVMGAPAHLVAFDERCTGFAHLHPAPATAGLAARSDAGQRLAFSLHLTDPGYYRLWAQVRVDGRDVFAPFGLHAQP